MLISFMMGCVKVNTVKINQNVKQSLCVIKDHDMKMYNLLGKWSASHSVERSQNIH
jgi:hypothetical protein